MTENKYLGNEALPEVIYAINNRLKTVVTMPATADDGQVLLYVGTASVNYETGHVYKYSSTDGWVDITSSVSVQVSTVADLEAIEVGQVVQYIGTTTSSYTKGYFYTKSQPSATLNITAGSGYYMTNISASDLQSTLPLSLYGDWTLNSVSDVDAAVSVIAASNKEVTCDNSDITITDAGASSISISYPAVSSAPSDPLTVTMSATMIVAVPTMDAEAPTASEVSYDDSYSELDVSDVQEAIDALNDKIPTVDQTYDDTSTNAQSGIAVAGAMGEGLSKCYPYTVASLATLKAALTDRADGLNGYNSYVPIHFYCSSDITMSNDEVLPAGTIITLAGNTSSGSGAPYGTAVDSTGNCYSVTCSDTIGTTINAYPLVKASRGTPEQIVLDAGEIGQLSVLLSDTAAQYQTANFLVSVPGTSGGFILFSVYTTGSQALIKQCCILGSTSYVPYYGSNSAVSGTDKHICIANNGTSSITISLLSCTTEFSNFGSWSTVSSLPSDVSSASSVSMITTGIHGASYVSASLSSSSTYSYRLGTAFINKQFYLYITRQGPGTVLLTPRILEFDTATSCIWREIGSDTWNTSTSSFTLSDGSVLTFSTVTQGTTYGVLTLSNPTSGYTYSMALFATFNSTIALTAL